MNKDDANIGRRYKCAGCGKAVLIGTCCDRGNRYCAGDCSKRARAESTRQAGRRYRQTRNGKSKGSARQASFRRRRESVSYSAILASPQREEIALHSYPPIPASVEIVTHHGSPPHPPSVPILAVPTVAPIADHKPFCCHFCGRLLSEFVRTSRLTQRIRHPIPLYKLYDRRKQHHDHAP